MKAVKLLVLAASTVFAAPTDDPGTFHDVARVAIVLGEVLRSRDVAPSTSLSGNYAPSKNVTCPPQLVRTANASVSVAPREAAYIAARRAASADAWRAYLSNSAVSSAGIDINAFLSNTSNLPNVGIAVSGGGFRAMLHGAAVVNGLDSRNNTAVSQGTGGVLQLANYLTGLSGGSWLVGSLAINNLPTITALRDIWNLTTNLIDPSGIVDDLKYYDAVFNEIQPKHDAGFDTSLTDYWGRALSRHLVNNSNNGLQTTFSSIQNLSAFTSHAMPFPIIISDGRSPGETVIPINTTIFEFSPFEFGSWHPYLKSFIPTEFIGTAAHAGQPNVTGVCVRGFDNAGFVMGTSATLFNAAILQLMNSSSAITSLLGKIAGGILGDDNDIASYPNTFNGINPTQFLSANSSNLDLVDGGEDNENVPLWPLLQPERAVDVILAIDGSADTYFSWPNGSSLVETRSRVFGDMYQNTIFYPDVPADTATFVNQGLNSRPTFFGCNATDLRVPLIVYIPNHPFISYTNFTTFTFEFSDVEVESFLDNGMKEVANNGTAFPTCLACALTYRSLQRSQTTPSSVCSQCFSTWCWNGVSNSTMPPNFDPSLPGVGAANQVGGAGTSDHPVPSQGNSAHIGVSTDGMTGLLVTAAAVLLSVVGGVVSVI